MCVCVRACVRACVRVCVSVCACVCVCSTPILSCSLYRRALPFTCQHKQRNDLFVCMLNKITDRLVHLPHTVDISKRSEMHNALRRKKMCSAIATVEGIDHCVTIIAKRLLPLTADSAKHTHPPPNTHRQTGYVKRSSFCSVSKNHRLQSYRFLLP